MATQAEILKAVADFARLVGEAKEAQADADRISREADVAAEKAHHAQNAAIEARNNLFTVAVQTDLESVPTGVKYMRGREFI